jgi:hypothetical protein
MASRAPQQAACPLMSPELTASFADGKKIRARAWILDAVFDVHSHPHLVSANDDETAISQAYVTSIFDSRASYIGRTMKGLDLFSFSLPANRSSLANKNAVPVVAILHGTHEISLQTVQALFGRMEGLWTSWTPLYFGPGTLYKALEDHAMYQTFLDTSSTFDPVKNLRVDYIGNSRIRQATLSKNAERSRVWTFAGVIDSARHPGLFNTYAIRHDYLRQRIISENSVWDQSADAWEIISYAIQKDWPLVALAPCPSLPTGYEVPVHGIFVHGSQNVRLSSVRSILDGIPGLSVTWTPVLVGKGTNLASTAVYREFLHTSTKELADSKPDSMIRVDVSGDSDNPRAQRRGPAKGCKRTLEPSAPPAPTTSNSEVSSHAPPSPLAAPPAPRALLSLTRASRRAALSDYSRAP